MAIIPFGNQFAAYPLKAQALRPFVPGLAKFPSFVGNSTAPYLTPLPLTPIKPQPGQRQVMPQLVGGSPVPIPGGQNVIPILPLPGGGSGGSSAVGYPIDSG